MIRKDDPQFKKVSDNVIAGMMKDGAINTLYTKWFMQPVPPKGLNLDFPLSDDMKALIKNPRTTRRSTDSAKPESGVRNGRRSPSVSF
ncbi:hypothetical protein ACTMU2_22795 [Cupriavidus basilensis]